MNAIIVDGQLKIAEKETGTVRSTQERNNLYKEVLQQMQELGTIRQLRQIRRGNSREGTTRD